MRKPSPMHLSFLTGHEQNSATWPHQVMRPGGTDVWILEYTVSGQGVVRSGDETRRLTAGDLIMFPPGVPQEYAMDPAVNAWDHLWVCFTPRSVWLDWLQWPLFGDGIYTLQVPEADRQRLHARLDDCVRYARGLFTRSFEFSMNALEEVLLWCDAFNPENQRTRMDIRLRNMLDVISTRYAAPWTLDELARLTDLSPWHFCHLCKAQTGHTPMQLLTAVRLTRAAELLLLTRHTITDIALSTGFSDPYYFSRLFRRQYQVAPREYRRQHTILS